MFQRLLPSILLLLAPIAAALPAYEPVHEYGVTRDAAKDIDDAVAEASRTGRRVLLEVGGEWCSWCHLLDEFWEDNDDVTEFREANYVMLKVNFSPENENQEVLSRYPKIEGYPHFFVLESDGSFLHSQGTGELESGDGHSKRKVMRFLRAWTAED